MTGPFAAFAWSSPAITLTPPEPGTPTRAFVRLPIGARDRTSLLSAPAARRTTSFTLHRAPRGTPRMR